MASQYITTNVRLPRSLYKTLKRRAFEEDKSLAALIRLALSERDVFSVSARLTGHKAGNGRRLAALADLARIAAPLGGNLAAGVDEIVYGKNSH